MNHKKRTTITTLVTGLAVSAALVACGSDDGSGGTSGDVEGKVTMWVYPIYDEGPMKEFFEDQAKAFEKKYPDATVDITVQPWDRRDEQLTSAITGNEAPDVVYMLPDQIPRYADQGAIDPVDDLLTDKDRDDYYPNALESATYDGDLYGVPILMQSIPVLCNKAVLDAAGVDKCPETWDDVKNMAPAVKNAGYYVYGYRGALESGLNLSFYPWLWAAGGNVLNDDGTEVTVNSAEGVEALSFLTDLYEGGHIPPNMLNEDAAEQNAIGQGKVAMVTGIEAQHVAPLWGEENVIVGKPLQNKEQVAFGTVGSLSMLSGSEAKAAAGAWITWLAQPDVLEEFDKAASFFAPRQSIKGLYADDPMLTAVEESLPMMKPGLISPYSRELQGIIAAQIQASLLGQKTPQQALDDAASEASTVVGR